jgi:hypothetical protein
MERVGLEKRVELEGRVHRLPPYALRCREASPR